MKIRNLLIFGIAVLLSFNSCKKEDIDEIHSIVGTWKYDTMDIELELAGDYPFDVQIIKLLVETMLKNETDITVIFEKNGTYSIAMSNSAFQYTHNDTGVYSMVAEKLYIDGVATTYKLSDTRLMLEYNLGDNFILSGDVLNDMINIADIKKFNASIWFDRMFYAVPIEKTILN